MPGTFQRARGCKSDKGLAALDGIMTRKGSLRIALVFVGAMGTLGGCARSEAHPVVSPGVPSKASAPNAAASNKSPPHRASPNTAPGCEATTVQEGKASWYGPNFHGGKTASGEKFDQHADTAAHPTLPLGTPIEVTNLENGRKTTLTVNDRGPQKKGRVLDVSKKGAQDLGFVSDGTAPVRIEAGAADCAGENQDSTEASNQGE